MGNAKNVFAGIVQTNYYNSNNVKIVAMASGTKNIDAERMSERTINDTHAEIVVRRALMRYFYDQLNLALDKCES